MENYVVNKLTSGIVVVKNILSLDEQLKLIDIVERHGNLKDENGNWNFKNNKGKSLRGREFERLTNYPNEDAKFLLEISEKFKIIVESADDTLTFKKVTHMLTLLYPTQRGGGWHVDGYGGNDGDEGAPVYSLTIGNTCIFEYQLVGEEIKQKVELCSGDIIVFGGKQRLMYHMAKSILMNTFAHKPGFNARINLTFRTCSELTKDDDEKYKTENYNKRLMEKWNTNKSNK